MSEKIIAATWARIEQKMLAQGVNEKNQEMARTAFTAGLYVAAAAISLERAHAREISEAAVTIERGKYWR